MGDDQWCLWSLPFRLFGFPLAFGVGCLILLRHRVISECVSAEQIEEEDGRPSRAHRWVVLRDWFPYAARTILPEFR